MLRWVFIGLIRLYQLTLSPFIGQVCRFSPTCSHYGIEAYRVHGSIKGTILTVWRILRCAPWSPGGYDPVPEKGKWNNRNLLEKFRAEQESSAVESKTEKGAISDSLPTSNGAKGKDSGEIFKP
jgi:uncharacterized protein